MRDWPIVNGTDPARVNQAVKELYATGLFSSVRTERAGGRIIVTVVENQMINRVFFEGNSKIKSDVLASEVQSRSRGAYNPSTVQADIARILADEGATLADVVRVTTYLEDTRDFGRYNHCPLRLTGHLDPC